MKYYGTLGPSCADTEVLRRMLQEGMTGIRLNLSHKSLQESEAWIVDYFMAADQEGVKVDFLIDLMGPELRIGTLEAEIKYVPNVLHHPDHAFSADQIKYQDSLTDVS